MIPLTTAGSECLRDIGLDVECERVATKGDCMLHTRWTHDMVGEEYARTYSWGNDPGRKVCYPSIGHTLSKVIYFSPLAINKKMTNVPPG
jgi:hypothetical protein